MGEGNLHVMPIGRTNPHARRLRRDATDVEQRFWLAVRDRRLAGFKFRRQVTIGPYVADFACIERRLIVELDGGQHDAGADAARTSYLEGLGWRVVRFWNNEVVENFEGVLEVVRAELMNKPSPNPLP